MTIPSPTFSQIVAQTPNPGYYNRQPSLSHSHSSKKHSCSDPKSTNPRNSCHHGDGYKSDDSSSTVSTLTFELSNTYILPEPFLVNCPFGRCADQSAFYFDSIHPLLDHLLSTHGIKVAHVGEVAGFMSAYLHAWSCNSKLIPNPCDHSIVPNDTINQGICGESTYELHTVQKLPSAAIHGHHRSAVVILGEDGDTWDSSLRNTLTKTKLSQIIGIMENERQTESHLPRKCLFCKVTPPNRAALFRHMFNTHSFNIGLPDNLVYVSHFLDILSDKLAQLQCLFCERMFKSSTVLRKHMRKKRHFRISSRNHEYDRFYVINYLEPGKHWETLTKTDQYFNDSEEDRCSVHSDAMTGTSIPYSHQISTGTAHSIHLKSVMATDEGDFSRWSDWSDHEMDDSARDSCPCLFCPEAHVSAEACVSHMALAHDFELSSVIKSLNISMYQTIVFINYLREQSLEIKCPAPNCASLHTNAFSDLWSLSTHLKTNHCLSLIEAPKGSKTVHVSLAGTNTRMGDENVLLAVASELCGHPSASKTPNARSLPSQWDKIGDTIVVVEGMFDSVVTRTDSFWDDQKYLFPTLDGDPLLAYCIEQTIDDNWDDNLK